MSDKLFFIRLSAVLILLVSTTLFGQGNPIVIFQDDYESFTAGQQLVCQDSVNWDTWSSISCDTIEDPYITNTIAFSGSNSVWIQQNNDLIKPIPHYTSGKYSISFKIYIPNNFMASWGQLSYFYGPDSTEWAVYVKFNLDGSGWLKAGGATILFPFSYDKWMNNELVIDLNNDWTEYYFEGNLVHGWQWSLGTYGDTCSLKLAVTDLMGSNWPDPGPSQWYLDDYVIERLDTATGIIDLPLLNEFKLETNYPNPFNPGTKIKYSVPQTSMVQIKVFDVLGNEIETLLKEEKPLGTYEITWYAEDLPSGVYFYQLKAGPFIETKKMILLR
jgi:hypothetical protein